MTCDPLHSSSRRASWLRFALACLGFLLFGLAQTRGVFNNGLPWDERLSEYIPWRVEAARQIAQGHFPFFTDRTLGGMPLFSLAYVGVLYPLNAAYLFFPPWIANYLELLHTVLGGAGMMLYLRARRLHGAASFAGGLLFLANTFMMTHAGHIAMREAAALSPWVAWAALRLQRRPTARGALAVSLLLALQIAAGYMQIVVLTVAWVAIDWVAGLRATRRLHVRTAWLAAAGALGFALMAAQIVPTLEHVRETPRDVMTLENWQTASFSPSHLPIFLNPRVFGIHSQKYLGDSYPGELIVTIPACGWALALIAVAMAVTIRRRREGPRGLMVIVYTFFIFFTFLLACGSIYEPNRLLFNVPPFNLFRVPSRWLFLTNTLAVVLAAVAMHWLLAMYWWRRLLLFTAGFAGWIALCLGLYHLLRIIPAETRVSDLPIGRMLLDGAAVSDGRATEYFWAASLPELGWAWDKTGMHLLLPLLAAIALLASRRRVAVGLAGFLLLLSINSWILCLYALMPPHPYRESIDPAAHLLLGQYPRGEIVRLYGLSPDGDNLGEKGFPHATALFHDIRSLNGYTPLLSKQLQIVFGIGQSGVSHRDPELYANPAPLGTLAVSHLVVQRKVMTDDRRVAYESGLAEGKYEVLVSGHGYDYLLLPQHRARFELSPKWTPAADLAQIESWAMLHPPDERGHVDLLEKPDWNRLPPADRRIEAGKVEVLEDDSSRQRVRVYTEKGGVLLIRDVHWPGWRYRIDGEDRTWRAVRRADGLIRYVPVPGGESVVTMVYRPPGFRNGLAISALAVVLCLLLAALGGKRIRTTARPQPSLSSDAA